MGLSKSLAARQKVEIFFPGVPARVLRLVNPLLRDNIVLRGGDFGGECSPPQAENFDLRSGFSPGFLLILV